MTKRGSHSLFLGIAVLAATMGSGSGAAAQPSGAPTNHVQGKEHYVMRDGLRIYLWEKYMEDQEGAFSRNGKVALLVHGGTRSGRSLYDLQIRDYSLMDFLAQNGYDVWAIDIHGYGHSTRRPPIGSTRILPLPILPRLSSTSRR